MPTAYPGRQLVHWQVVRITAKCRTYRMHYLLTHLMHLLFQLGLLHCRSVVDTGHAMHQLRHALHSLAHPLSLLRSEIAARHWYGHTARLQGHALHHVGHHLLVLAHAGPPRNAAVGCPLTDAAVNMPKQRTGAAIETAVILLMSMLP